MRSLHNDASFADEGNTDRTHWEIIVVTLQQPCIIMLSTGQNLYVCHFSCFTSCMSQLVVVAQ